MPLPPMRTLTKAHEEIMAADPSCGLTMTALRRLVRAGAIGSVRVGNKYLINLDNLYSYLSGVDLVEPTTTAQVPGIRRVES